MRYNLKGTGLDISAELRAYMERALAGTDKFLEGDQTAFADVELQYLEEGRSGKYRAEFTIAASGEVYRASSWGTSMHEALDLAAGALQRELSRAKKKRLHMLRRGAVRVKEYLRGFRRRP